MNKLVPTLLVLVALSVPTAQAGVLSKSVSLTKSVVTTLVVNPVKKVAGVTKGLVQGTVGLLEQTKLQVLAK